MYIVTYSKLLIKNNFHLPLLCRSKETNLYSATYYWFPTSISIGHHCHWSRTVKHISTSEEPYIPHSWFMFFKTLSICTIVKSYQQQVLCSNSNCIGKCIIIFILNKLLWISSPDFYLKSNHSTSIIYRNTFAYSRLHIIKLPHIGSP